MMNGIYPSTHFEYRLDNIQWKEVVCLKEDNIRSNNWLHGILKVT